MFISTKYLVTKYGIDESIARYFVDREPPENNLYWHEKLLYLRPASGYLIFPFFIDILNRIDFPREEVLSEHFITTIEHIAHISALEEIKSISNTEAITRCADLVKIGSNINWLNTVISYLRDRNNNNIEKWAPDFLSLRRGDIFLFSLSVLDFSHTKFELIARHWFALISVLLIIDDAEDLESDIAHGEMNSFVEAGLDLDGLAKIAAIADNCFQLIATLNQAMADELKRQYEQHVASIQAVNL